MIEQITLISCETNYVYELIKNSPLWKHMKEKLAIIPNGFDYEEIAECGIEFKSYRDKENTFCVIGRLSAPEKNVSLILEAIKGIDLKDWKIIFVGYIEKYSELEKNINDILIIKGAKNIIITGEIKERKSLYEIYNKSKCFILSSNSESYGNVLLEASFFGNYIISTRVGVANDITENGKLGSIIEPGNVKELALAIKKVINNEIDIEAITNVLTKKVNREFKWISIVENEAFHKLFK